MYTIGSNQTDCPAEDGRAGEWMRFQAPARRGPTGSWAIIGMILITVALILSPASRLLLYTYPLMAVLIGGYLYRRHITSYVGLVCWLWFLTPLVRRLLDYRAGWTQPTAVLLAPPLAALVPVVLLFPDWRQVLRRHAAPLLGVLITCIYATCIGLLNYSAKFVFQDLLTWVAPLVFALMLCWHSEQAPELFEAFEKAFLYGLLVVGIYGLAQFFLMPKWDAFWMGWVSMDSIGKPLPTEVRVFSTMNAPQILASFLAAGLIIAFNSQRKIRFLSIPLGLICLALSLARSGWVAMAAGTLYLLFTLPQRQRFRLVMAGTVAALVMLAALQNPDLQDVMSQRFETFTSVRNDTSFMDRMDNYRSLVAGFVDYPFGAGMGSTPAMAVSTTQPAANTGWQVDLGDSTIAMLTTTLGLAGTMVLLGFLLPLAPSLFRGESVNAAYTHVMRAVLIGMIAEAALDGVVSGPTGFLTWGSLGFCIALSARKKETTPAFAAGEVAA